MKYSYLMATIVAFALPELGLSQTVERQLEKEEIVVRRIEDLRAKVFEIQPFLNSENPADRFLATHYIINELPNGGGRPTFAAALIAANFESVTGFRPPSDWLLHFRQQHERPIVLPATKDQQFEAKIISRKILGLERPLTLPDSAVPICPEVFTFASSKYVFAVGIEQANLTELLIYDSEGKIKKQLKLFFSQAPNNIFEIGHESIFVGFALDPKKQRVFILTRALEQMVIEVVDLLTLEVSELYNPESKLDLPWKRDRKPANPSSTER